MNIFMRRNMKQRACHWANPVNDGLGQTTFDDPAEICCRWEFKRQQGTNADGEQTTFSAVIYTHATVVPGEWLWLGCSRNLPSASSHPMDVFKAVCVLKVDTLVGLNDRIGLNVVYV